MGSNTGISWATHTFNGWIGCTKVSEERTGGGACDGCYAENEADHRYGIVEWGAGKPRHKTKTWRDPIKWNKAAPAFYAEHGYWPRVFAMSWADLFDNEVPDVWHLEMNDLIEATPNLRWMLTTKRAVNIPKMMPPEFFRLNQHVGVIISVCNQREVERDVPRILELKRTMGIAWVGISLGPLLGAVNLHKAIEGPILDDAGDRGLFCALAPGGLDWVITEGESGKNARPTNPQWFRDVRDQCARAGVPYHHKQNGEWVSVSEVEGPGEHYKFPDGRTVRRIGVKHAGRTIDGKKYNGFPARLTA